MKQYLEYEYVEYAQGHVSNRNMIIKRTDITASPNQVSYASMFSHTKELKAFVDMTSSVEGYGGMHIGDWLIDLDGTSKNSLKLEDVRAESIALHNRLTLEYQVPPDAIKVYFSGMKGFHIEIPWGIFGEIHASVNYSWIIKQITKEITYDLKSVDLKLYHPTRLIRIPNTPHQDTGLYKIPLSFGELTTLSIEQLTELAKTPRHIFDEAPLEVETVLPLSESFTKWSQEGLSTETDGSQKSSSKGNKKKKLDDINPDYFYTLEKASYEYASFVRQGETRKVRIGFPEIDRAIRGIMPGEVLCVQGKTSSGKSALLQNIGRNYALSSGMPVLFFSIEMPSTAVFERAVQMECEMPAVEVEQGFLEHHAGLPEIASITSTTLHNLYIITDPKLYLDKVERWIKFAEGVMYKKKTGLVLIDYLGLISASGENQYVRVSNIARQLKQLAKEFDIPVAFLSQVSKAVTINEKPSLDSARDSGSIAEAADFVLSLWQDFDQEKETGEEVSMNLTIAKNRKGGIGTVKLLMNRRTLQMKEMRAGDKGNSHSRSH